MDKNCGACGYKTCKEYLDNLKSEDFDARGQGCPYDITNENKKTDSGGSDDNYYGTDIVGVHYDFILHPFPDEPSARKFIVPFRTELVDMIRIGDLIMGRPAGAGCPVYHCLKVLSVNCVTAVLECHVVGPLKARDGKMPIDLQCYHIHAFEGIAEPIATSPEFGKRQKFLPSYCMMNLSHTGVVNMILKKDCGLHVRLEDIRIL